MIAKYGLQLINYINLFFNSTNGFAYINVTEVKIFCLHNIVNLSR